jgi:hypothetical protein
VRNSYRIEVQKNRLTIYHAVKTRTTVVVGAIATPDRKPAAAADLCKYIQRIAPCHNLLRRYDILQDLLGGEASGESEKV